MLENFVGNKLKFQGSKNKTLSTVVLILTMVFSLFAILPLVNAHTPAWTLPTTSYVSVSPNPVGLGQKIIVVFWSDKVPPTAIGANGDRWDGWTVEVTKPDGTKETLGPFTSDPVGGGYTLYTPAMLGRYTFMAKFPEQKAEVGPGSPSGYRVSAPGLGPLDFVNDTYAASNSAPVTLTVQQAQISTWSETPLPTSYWTRPIYAENRNWASLAGNWLAGAAQNAGPTVNFAYGAGPESSHIMWATPIWAGGIMDDRFNDFGFQTVHYEGITFSPPIIIAGKIYYNTPSFPMYGWHCADLYTGEEIWFHNSTGPIQYGGNADTAGMNVSRYPMLSFAQILDFESPNQHGGFPYLWVTYHPNYTAPYTFPANKDVWQMYDAVTGNWLLNIENAPTTGTAVYGNDGSILRYNVVNLGTVANPKFYLQVWNTTEAILYRSPEQYAEVTATTSYWLWRPVSGQTFDGRYGYSSNVSIPAVQGSILAVREGQYVIGGTLGTNSYDGVKVDGNLWALNLDRSQGPVGKLLWNITFTPPLFPQRSQTSQTNARMGAVMDPEDGAFIFSDTTTRRVWCYNLKDGTLRWGPTEPGPQFDYYGMGNLVYQGKFFTYGYGGQINAFDIATGKLLWNYTALNVGQESPYGGNYPLSLACVADGKLYMYSTEHSPSTPLWRGSLLRCIDASNGTELWTISHWGSAVASDGYLVGLDYYDNQIYCYGKGPSGTTVTAPENAQPLGTTVMIKGTVTDQSVGAKGTPAIADESMTAWMEYTYKQQPKPTDAKGVKVHLTVIDPNGNFQDIGTATSNTLGNYAIAWTPPVSGLYTITATFDGSDSYFTSKAGTSFVVSTAPSAAPITTAAPTQTVAPTSTPAQTPASPSPSIAPQPTSGMPTTTYIAIGAAVVIIVAAAAALLLRRRK